LEGKLGSEVPGDIEMKNFPPAAEAGETERALD